MAGKKTAVFGIYGTSGGAENAVDTLTTSGFPISDVSLLVPETLGNREMGTEKATKAPEGTAAGATSGAVLGGTLGLGQDFRGPMAKPQRMAALTIGCVGAFAEALIAATHYVLQVTLITVAAGALWTAGRRLSAISSQLKARQP